MTMKDDGGPAFPQKEPLTSDCQGMTLRDWFAGQADLTGYSFPDSDVAAKTMNIDPPFDDSLSEQMRFSFRLQSAIRYALADAMLAARK